MYIVNTCTCIILCLHTLLTHMHIQLCTDQIVLTSNTLNIFTCSILVYTLVLVMYNSILVYNFREFDHNTMSHFVHVKFLHAHLVGVHWPYCTRTPTKPALGQLNIHCPKW